jgi:hypothetical protein
MSLLNSASLCVTPNGYKAGTLYSVIPNTTLGDMTVVRATTATRVNSAGLIESVANNVPRLDYLNASCPSLLLEPQRTNLFTNSETFDSANWTKSGATITANVAVSPDGYTNADLQTGGEIYQQKTQPNATACTMSVFVKKDTAASATIRYIDNVSGFVGGGITYTYATNAITILQSANASVSGEAISYGNGWYRLILKYTSAASVTFNYQGIQAGGSFIYGAQFETSAAYATSYIPTTSAAVTRNADEIYKTGISSLINSTEGVLFVETKGFFDAQPYSTYIQLSKNGESVFDNSLVLQHRNNGYLRVYVNGSATTNLNFNIDIDFTQNHKIAVLYKLNGYKLFIDGVAQSLFGTPTQTVFSGLDNLSFDLRGSNSWNAKIKNLIVFPSALSDTELTELTTL